MSVSVPIPPPELVSRIGGTRDNYIEIGAAQRRILERLLPSGWSFQGKSVLDFGCGTGRTLSAFLQDAQRAEFSGCDIHAESIAWASADLSPPLHFFVCRQAPPLAQPDQRFDLVFAMSVFTHITHEWSRWLVELHRVLRPGGLAVISVLGAVAAEKFVGIDWDDRIGMACVDLEKGWELGGPSVLLAEWWIREHWGRAFEILSFEPGDAWFSHDFVVMRKRDAPVCAEQLEAVDRSDPREYAAIVRNLELLETQQQTLGDRLNEASRGRLAADVEVGRLRNREAELGGEITRLTRELVRQEAELQRLQEMLDVVTASNSWRLTAPLRRARTITGNRR